MLGGLFGNHKAADKRRKPLVDARAAVGRATLEYDAAVTKAVAAADQQWREKVVPAKTAELAAVQNALCAKVRQAIIHARRTGMSADEQAVAVAAEHLTMLVDNSSHRKMPVLAARRRTTWRQHAEDALRRADLADILDLLLANQRERPVVEDVLRSRSRRPATALAAAVEGGQRATRVAIVAHDAAMAELAMAQQQLGAEVQRKVHPPALELWRSANKVRYELVATGSKTPDWVKEILPVPDQPSWIRPDRLPARPPRGRSGPSREYSPGTP